MVPSCILFASIKYFSLILLGFSDPYCMLGIVPELRKFVLPQQSNGASGVSSDEEGGNAHSPNENKLGFMKRLKSFRKSTLRRSQARDKPVSNTGTSPQNNSSLRDKLPAKYIQTTDVKKATLNPVWMEKFRLYVSNAVESRSGRLHVVGFLSSLPAISKVAKRRPSIWIFGITTMNSRCSKRPEN